MTAENTGGLRQLRLATQREADGAVDRLWKALPRFLVVQCEGRKIGMVGGQLAARHRAPPRRHFVRDRTRF